MTSRERFQAVLRHDKDTPIPVWPQAFLFPGAYCKLSQKIYSTNVESFVKAQIKAYHDFGWDAVGAYPDIVMEPEAYGCATVIPDDREPYVTKDVALADDAKLDELIAAGFRMGPRMEMVLEANQRLKQAVGHDVFIFSGQRSPLSLACELRGIEQLMLDLALNADMVKKLMTFTTGHAIAYARAQLDAGADVIELGNSSGSLVSPEMFHEFVEPCLKQVFDAVKDAGGIACLHSCGQTTHLLEYMTGAGPDIIEIDYPHDMPDVVAEYPETVWLGNLDPVTVLLQSQPDHIEQRVTELLEQVMGCGNFVLSTGCEPSMLTPPENMAAFMRAAKRFNGDD